MNPPRPPVRPVAGRDIPTDEGVELERVALELTYRMNWEKACQACAQFGWYRTRRGEGEAVSGGLVVFETFAGD